MTPVPMCNKDYYTDNATSKAATAITVQLAISIITDCS